MSIYAWVFITMCAAVLIPWALLTIGGRIGRALRHEQEHYEALRTPDMGHPAVSPDEPTPIFDQLAAEHVIASAGAVVAEAWGDAAEVYDVEWPESPGGAA